MAEEEFQLDPYLLEQTYDAIGDLSLRKNVQRLGEELLSRFPKIDELINNAGIFTLGGKETTEDGIDKHVAVNVLAPLLLTRILVPTLKAANPVGKVQITSGGSPLDTFSFNPLDGEHVTGMLAYSHSKRVTIAMAISLSKELEPDGIVCDVVGGALPGATSMTKDISFKDMPFMFKAIYPCFKWFMSRDDGVNLPRPVCNLPFGQPWLYQGRDRHWQKLFSWTIRRVI